LSSPSDELQEGEKRKRGTEKTATSIPKKDRVKAKEGKEVHVAFPGKRKGKKKMTSLLILEKKKDGKAVRLILSRKKKKGNRVSEKNDIIDLQGEAEGGKGQAKQEAV